ncbi:hypothetical protein TRIUR3_24953 [Triticum urartu]|uniref:Uncharacterized protein n=2 Tax=Triticum TaxID=4564 RepID=A0A9R0Z009_TRITD|nr:hypothetical protein TRIUR3_24953 [Triticum urartu]VAI68444.1 unnamed protein product [Triticum turgidum subsp. durum]
MTFGGIFGLPGYILFGDKEQERKLRKRKKKLQRERKLRLQQERKLRQREQELQWLLLRQQPRQPRGTKVFSKESLAVARSSNSVAVPRGYERQGAHGFSRDYLPASVAVPRDRGYGQLGGQGQGFSSDSLAVARSGNSSAVPRGYGPQDAHKFLLAGHRGYEEEDFSASDDEDDDEDDDDEDDEDAFEEDDEDEDDENDEEVEEGEHRRLMLLTLQQGGQGVPRVHPGGRLEWL